MTKQKQDLFWADKIASKIIKRKKFHYLNKPIPKFKKYVVKTSASISGVLHIGRLSDTIRSENVVKALQDKGKKAELIWVTEDMDPLRKIPKGMPKSYEEYIGMPVTNVPDPYGCHKSYAEHNVAEYMEVLDEFVATKMKKFSTAQEYKKGNFNPYIKKILSSIKQLKEILNKYRTLPLSKDWSPWQPICENCGKIMTPRVTGFEDGKIKYECKDYKFKTTKAKGCGFKGEVNPLKDKGKLVWKSEWAAEWALWKVISEGAGKEYQVPSSAWWVNAEICEKLLDFPMPEPIFYEHITINGKKMSASLGNVVYPKDWLKVAPAELLRFFYNKRLMKTRSFSWKELPNLYDDYDYHEKVFFNKVKPDNKKEEMHIKRLFETSQLTKPKLHKSLPFTFAAFVSQSYDPKKNLKQALKVFESTGHLKKITKKDEKYLEKLLVYAKNWLEHVPEAKIVVAEKVNPAIKKALNTQENKAIKELTSILKKDLNGEQLQHKIYETAKKHSIQPRKFFEILYKIILNKNQGPRLGPFIIAVGKERVLELLKQI
ncbi:lysine--tRNA ligase [Candidatus Pacearchaeota archaeon ex4484_26]|nr:MAG: lysine--tRNA ligase [Candidatus Pacearchaeota archaeon ex4484_26]